MAIVLCEGVGQRWAIMGVRLIDKGWRPKGWTEEARERDQGWAGKDGICQKVVQAT